MGVRVPSSALMSDYFIHRNIGDDVLEEGLNQLIECKEATEDNLRKILDEIAPDRASKTNIIWRIEKKIKEADSKWAVEDGIKKATIVAKILANDSDPDKAGEGLELNKKIEDGEEIRIIYTVRGSVPWLLQKLIGTFNSKVYTQIIEIVEELAKDDIHYVRQQAMVPLALLASNIRARKDSKGEPFYFGSKQDDIGNRIKVRKLCFHALDRNRKYPQVLRYVANAFSGMRVLNSREAEEILRTFFYGNFKEKKLQPDYLTQHVTPLAIFFAEFRESIMDEEFKFTESDSRFFKDFLRQLIKDSQGQSAGLLRALLWSTQKEISDDQKSYSLMQKYFDQLLESSNFLQETLVQRTLLIREVARREGPRALNYVNQISSQIESVATNEGEAEIGTELIFIPEILKLVDEKNPGVINGKLSIFRHLPKWQIDALRKENSKWFADGHERE